MLYVLDSGGNLKRNSASLPDPVTIPHGGTGVTTLTNHGVVIGQAAAALVASSAGTAGQTLRSGGASADPAFAATWSYVSSTVTGTQNNYALGFTGDGIINWSGASDATFTGFAAGTTGQHVTVKNTGSKVAYFTHNSGSSSAGNKLFNLVTSGITPVAPGGFITYFYDETQWQIVDHEQGAWITIPFVAGDWICSGSMTITMDAGDVLTDAYLIQGKTFHYSFFYNGFTLGGTAHQQVRRLVPNNYTFTVSGTGSGGPLRVYDNGTYRIGFGFVYTSTDTTHMIFTIYDLSNFALSTNNSGLFGFLEFEID
jgi:hypothetical protein